MAGSCNRKTAIAPSPTRAGPCDRLRRDATGRPPLSLPVPGETGSRGVPPGVHYSSDLRRPPFSSPLFPLSRARHCRLFSSHRRPPPADPRLSRRAPLSPRCPWSRAPPPPPRTTTLPLPSTWLRSTSRVDGRDPSLRGTGDREPGACNSDRLRGIGLVALVRDGSFAAPPPSPLPPHPPKRRLPSIYISPCTLRVPCLSSTPCPPLESGLVPPPTLVFSPPPPPSARPRRPAHHVS